MAGHRMQVNHYNLHPYQGRGAPEIDILEAMAGVDEELPATTIRRPYISSSLQVGPGARRCRCRCRRRRTCPRPPLCPRL